MPIEMNLLEAVKYKDEHSDRRVWYAPEEAEFLEEYFEEDLIGFRGEYRFELNAKYEYPGWFDHDNRGWSHFYNRHLYNPIYVETGEECEERIRKEIADAEEKVKKDKKKLEREIKKKTKELEELKSRNR